MSFHCGIWDWSREGFTNPEEPWNDYHHRMACCPNCPEVEKQNARQTKKGKGAKALRWFFFEER
jgi:hypothetical protein